MTEIFQDGEPVDPLKLQRLQDQITAISNKANDAYDLGNKLSGQQQEVIFHVKAGVESFEGGFTAGQVRTQAIDLEWKPEYTNVYTTCTLRSKNPSLNIRATMTGDVRQPMIAVYTDKKIDYTLNVHWISVASKPITE